MFFDGNFATSAPSILNRWCGRRALGEDAWLEYVRRQEKFEPHRQTLSIPLLYDNDMRHADPTPWPRLAELEPVLAARARPRSAQAHAPAAGPTTRAISSGSSSLTSAPARSSPRTAIMARSMLRSHRYHLALITNDQVEFAIESQSSISRPARSGKSTIASCTRCATSARKPRVHAHPRLCRAGRGRPRSRPASSSPDV